MFVMSAPGTKCPKERKPRQYISDAAPHEVPNTSYYRRLVADGSLVIVPEPATKPRESARAKERESEKAGASS